MKINNQPQLLDEMLEDLAAAPSAYRPDGYWTAYREEHVRWLRSADLNAFRQFGAPFSAFGGGAAAPSKAHTDALKATFNGSLLLRTLDRVLDRIGTLLPSAADHIEILRPRTSVNNLARARVFQAKHARQQLEMLEAEDPELLEIADQGIGQPSDLVTYQGKRYSQNLVDKLIEYHRASDLLSLEEMAGVLEIGPGYGQQMEVLLRADPQRHGCIVEIPPQLYIAQQYLEAAFPGQVAKYQDIKERGVEGAIEDHRVVCLAPWQVQELPEDTYDLLWNMASFQEMAPATVEMYAEALQPVIRKALYLVNDIGGDEDLDPEVRTQATWQEVVDAFDTFAPDSTVQRGAFVHGTFTPTDATGERNLQPADPTR